MVRLFQDLEVRREGDAVTVRAFGLEGGAMLTFKDGREITDACRN
jgi:hypothetical protein